MIEHIKYLLEKFQADYKEFITTDMLVADALTVSKKANIFTNYYCQLNEAKAKAEYQYNKVLSGLLSSTDENGKAMSSAKAEQLAGASIEYSEYLDLKAAIQSLDQILFSLTNQQKALLKEFGHTSTI